MKLASQVLIAALRVDPHVPVRVVPHGVPRDELGGELALAHTAASLDSAGPWRKFRTARIEGIEDAPQHIRPPDEALQY